MNITTQERLLIDQLISKSNELRLIYNEKLNKRNNILKKKEKNEKKKKKNEKKKKKDEKKIKKSFNLSTSSISTSPISTSPISTTSSISSLSSSISNSISNSKLSSILNNINNIEHDYINIQDNIINNENNIEKEINNNKNIYQLLLKLYKNLYYNIREIKLYNNIIIIFQFILNINIITYDIIKFDNELTYEIKKNLTYYNYQLNINNNINIKDNISISKYSSFFTSLSNSSSSSSSSSSSTSVTYFDSLDENLEHDCWNSLKISTLFSTSTPPTDSTPPTTSTTSNSTIPQKSLEDLHQYLFQKLFYYLLSHPRVSSIEQHSFFCFLCYLSLNPNEAKAISFLSYFFLIIINQSRFQCQKHLPNSSTSSSSSSNTSALKGAASIFFSSSLSSFSTSTPSTSTPSSFAEEFLLIISSGLSDQFYSKQDELKLFLNQDRKDEKVNIGDKIDNSIKECELEVDDIKNEIKNIDDKVVEQENSNQNLFSFASKCANFLKKSFFLSTYEDKEEEDDDDVEEDDDERREELDEMDKEIFSKDNNENNGKNNEEEDDDDLSFYSTRSHNLTLKSKSSSIYSSTSDSISSSSSSDEDEEKEDSSELIQKNLKEVNEEKGNPTTSSASRPSSSISLPLCPSITFSPFLLPVLEIVSISSKDFLLLFSSISSLSFSSLSSFFFCSHNSLNKIFLLDLNLLLIQILNSFLTSFIKFNSFLLSGELSSKAFSLGYISSSTSPITSFQSLFEFDSLLTSFLLLAFTLSTSIVSSSSEVSSSVSENSQNSTSISSTSTFSAAASSLSAAASSLFSSNTSNPPRRASLSSKSGLSSSSIPPISSVSVSSSSLSTLMFYYFESSLLNLNEIFFLYEKFFIHSSQSSSFYSSHTTSHYSSFSSFSSFIHSKRRNQSHYYLYLQEKSRNYGEKMIYFHQLMLSSLSLFMNLRTSFSFQFSPKNLLFYNQYLSPFPLYSNPSPSSNLSILPFHILSTSSLSPSAFLPLLPSSSTSSFLLSSSPLLSQKDSFYIHLLINLLRENFMKINFSFISKYSSSFFYILHMRDLLQDSKRKNDRSSTFSTTPSSPFSSPLTSSLPSSLNLFQSFSPFFLLHSPSYFVLSPSQYLNSFENEDVINEAGTEDKVMDINENEIEEEEMDKEKIRKENEKKRKDEIKEEEKLLEIESSNKFLYNIYKCYSDNFLLIEKIIVRSASATAALSNSTSTSTSSPPHPDDSIPSTPTSAFPSSSSSTAISSPDLSPYYDYLFSLHANYSQFLSGLFEAVYQELSKEEKVEEITENPGETESMKERERKEKMLNNLLNKVNLEEVNNEREEEKKTSKISSFFETLVKIIDLEVSHYSLLNIYPHSYPNKIKREKEREKEKEKEKDREYEREKNQKSREKERREKKRNSIHSTSSFSQFQNEIELEDERRDRKSQSEKREKDKDNEESFSSSSLNFILKLYLTFLQDLKENNTKKPSSSFSNPSSRSTLLKNNFYSYQISSKIFNFFNFLIFIARNTQNSVVFSLIFHLFFDFFHCIYVKRYEKKSLLKFEENTKKESLLFNVRVKEGSEEKEKEKSSTPLAPLYQPLNSPPSLLNEKLYEGLEYLYQKNSSFFYLFLFQFIQVANRNRNSLKSERVKEREKEFKRRREQEDIEREKDGKIENEREKNKRLEKEKEENEENIDIFITVEEKNIMDNVEKSKNMSLNLHFSLTLDYFNLNELNFLFFSLSLSTFLDFESVFLKSSFARAISDCFRIENDASILSPSSPSSSQSPLEIALSRIFSSKSPLMNLSCPPYLLQQLISYHFSLALVNFSFSMLEKYLFRGEERKIEKEDDKEREDEEENEDEDEEDKDDDKEKKMPYSPSSLTPSSPLSPLSPIDPTFNEKENQKEELKDQKNKMRQKDKEKKLEEQLEKERHESSLIYFSVNHLFILSEIIHSLLSSLTVSVGDLLLRPQLLRLMVAEGIDPSLAFLVRLIRFYQLLLLKYHQNMKEDDEEDREREREARKRDRSSFSALLSSSRFSSTSPPPYSSTSSTTASSSSSSTSLSLSLPPTLLPLANFKLWRLLWTLSIKKCPIDSEVENALAFLINNVSVSNDEFMFQFLIRLYEKEKKMIKILETYEKNLEMFVEFSSLNSFSQSHFTPPSRFSSTSSAASPLFNLTKERQKELLETENEYFLIPSRLRKYWKETVFYQRKRTCQIQHFYYYKDSISKENDFVEDVTRLRSSSQASRFSSSSSIPYPSNLLFLTSIQREDLLRSSYASLLSYSYYSLYNFVITISNSSYYLPLNQDEKNEVDYYFFSSSNPRPNISSPGEKISISKEKGPLSLLKLNLEIHRDDTLLPWEDWVYRCILSYHQKRRGLLHLDLFSLFALAIDQDHIHDQYHFSSQRSYHEDEKNQKRYSFDYEVKQRRRDRNYSRTSPTIVSSSHFTSTFKYSPKNYKEQISLIMFDDFFCHGLAEEWLKNIDEIVQRFDQVCDQEEREREEEKEREEECIKEQEDKYHEQDTNRLKEKQCERRERENRLKYRDDIITVNSWLDQLTHLNFFDYYHPFFEFLIRKCEFLSLFLIDSRPFLRHLGTKIFYNLFDLVLKLLKIEKKYREKSEEKKEEKQNENNEEKVDSAIFSSDETSASLPTFSSSTLSSSSSSYILSRFFLHLLAQVLPFDSLGCSKISLLISTTCRGHRLFYHFFESYERIFDRKKKIKEEEKEAEAEKKRRKKREKENKHRNSSFYSSIISTLSSSSLSDSSFFSLSSSPEISYTSPMNHPLFLTSAMILLSSCLSQWVDQINFYSNIHSSFLAKRKKSSLFFSSSSSLTLASTNTSSLLPTTNMPSSSLASSQLPSSSSSSAKLSEKEFQLIKKLKFEEIISSLLYILYYIGENIDEKIISSSCSSFILSYFNDLSMDLELQMNRKKETERERFKLGDNEEDFTLSFSKEYVNENLKETERKQKEIILSTLPKQSKAFNSLLTRFSPQILLKFQKILIKIIKNEENYFEKCMKIIEKNRKIDEKNHKNNKYEEILLKLKDKIELLKSLKIKNGKEREERIEYEKDRNISPLSSTPSSNFSSPTFSTPYKSDKQRKVSFSTPIQEEDDDDDDDDENERELSLISSDINLDRNYFLSYSLALELFLINSPHFFYFSSPTSPSSSSFIEKELEENEDEELNKLDLVILHSKISKDYSELYSFSISTSNLSSIFSYNMKQNEDNLLSLWDNYFFSNNFYFLHNFSSLSSYTFISFFYYDLLDLIKEKRKLEEDEKYEEEREKHEEIKRKERNLERKKEREKNLSSISIKENEREKEKLKEQARKIKKINYNKNIKNIEIKFQNLLNDFLLNLSRIKLINLTRNHFFILKKILFLISTNFIISSSIILHQKMFYFFHLLSSSYSFYWTTLLPDVFLYIEKNVFESLKRLIEKNDEIEEDNKKRKENIIDNNNEDNDSISSLSTSLQYLLSSSFFYSNKTLLKYFLILRLENIKKIYLLFSKKISQLFSTRTASSSSSSFSTVPHISSSLPPCPPPRPSNMKEKERKKDNENEKEIKFSHTTLSSSVTSSLFSFYYRLYDIFLDIFSNSFHLVYLLNDPNLKEQLLFLFLKFFSLFLSSSTSESSSSFTFFSSLHHHEKIKKKYSKLNKMILLCSYTSTSSTSSYLPLLLKQVPLYNLSTSSKLPLGIFGSYYCIYSSLCGFSEPKSLGKYMREEEKKSKLLIDILKTSSVKLYEKEIEDDREEDVEDKKKKKDKKSESEIFDKKHDMLSKKNMTLYNYLLLFLSYFSSDPLSSTISSHSSKLISSSSSSLPLFLTFFNLNINYLLYFKEFFSKDSSSLLLYDKNFSYFLSSYEKFLNLHHISLLPSSYFPDYSSSHPVFFSSSSSSRGFIFQLSKENKLLSQSFPLYFSSLSHPYSSYFTTSTLSSHCFSTEKNFSLLLNLLSHLMQDSSLISSSLSSSSLLSISSPLSFFSSSSFAFLYNLLNTFFEILFYQINNEKYKNLNYIFLPQIFHFLFLIKRKMLSFSLSSTYLSPINVSISSISSSSLPTSLPPSSSTNYSQTTPLFPPPFSFNSSNITTSPSSTLIQYNIFSYSLKKLLQLLSLLLSASSVSSTSSLSSYHLLYFFLKIHQKNENKYEKELENFFSFLKFTYFFDSPLSSNLFSSNSSSRFSLSLSPSLSPSFTSQTSIPSLSSSYTFFSLLIFFYSDSSIRNFLNKQKKLSEINSLSILFSLHHILKKKKSLNSSSRSSSFSSPASNTLPPPPPLSFSSSSTLLKEEDLLIENNFYSHKFFQDLLLFFTLPEENKDGKNRERKFYSLYSIGNFSSQSSSIFSFFILGNEILLQKKKKSSSNSRLSTSSRFPPKSSYLFEDQDKEKELEEIVEIRERRDNDEEKKKIENYKKNLSKSVSLSFSPKKLALETDKRYSSSSNSPIPPLNTASTSSLPRTSSTSRLLRTLSSSLYRTSSSSSLLPFSSPFSTPSSSLSLFSCTVIEGETSILLSLLLSQLISTLNSIYSIQNSKTLNLIDPIQVHFFSSPSLSSPSLSTSSSPLSSYLDTLSSIFLSPSNSPTNSSASNNSVLSSSYLPSKLIVSSSYGKLSSLLNRKNEEEDTLFSSSLLSIFLLCYLLNIHSTNKIIFNILKNYQKDEKANEDEDTTEPDQEKKKKIKFSLSIFFLLEILNEFLSNTSKKKEKSLIKISSNFSNLKKGKEIEKEQENKSSSTSITSSTLYKLPSFHTPSISSSSTLPLDIRIENEEEIEKEEREIQENFYHNLFQNLNFETKLIEIFLLVRSNHEEFLHLFSLHTLSLSSNSSSAPLSSSSPHTSPFLNLSNLKENFIQRLYLNMNKNEAVRNFMSHFSKEKMKKNEEKVKKFEEKSKKQEEILKKNDENLEKIEVKSTPKRFSSPFKIFSPSSTDSAKRSSSKSKIEGQLVQEKEIKEKSPTPQRSSFRLPSPSKFFKRLMEEKKKDQEETPQEQDLSYYLTADFNTTSYLSPSPPSPSSSSPGSSISSIEQLQSPRPLPSTPAFSSPLSTTASRFSDFSSYSSSPQHSSLSSFTSPPPRSSIKVSSPSKFFRKSFMERESEKDTDKVIEKEIKLKDRTKLERQDKENASSLSSSSISIKESKENSNDLNQLISPNPSSQPSITTTSRESDYSSISSPPINSVPPPSSSRSSTPLKKMTKKITSLFSKKKTKSDNNEKEETEERIEN